QGAQQPLEIESTSARKQPIGACLADDLLHVRGALGPRIAELRIAQELARHLRQRLQAVPRAKEMNRIDQQAAVTGCGAVEDAHCLREIRNVHPGHRLQVGRQPIAGGEIAKPRKVSINRASLESAPCTRSSVAPRRCAVAITASNSLMSVWGARRNTSTSSTRTPVSASRLST